MRTQLVGRVLLSVGGGLGLLLMVMYILADHQFERQYAYLWDAALKSSTVSAKQQLLVQFRDTLQAGAEKGDFAQNNALFLKTPDDSFETNMAALGNLIEWLAESQKMSPASFEYHATIQQIAAQERNVAIAVLPVLRGCYYRNNWPMVWGGRGILVLFICVFSAMVGIAIFMDPPPLTVLPLPVWGCRQRHGK